MPELAPELKAALAQDQENRKKLAEVFSQCWDDAKFQARFIEHPKEVMDEYGVKYDKSKDYRILPSKDKVITFVLPYENVKAALQAAGNAFLRTAEKSTDTRAVLPEGWAAEFIQNQQDTNYIVIPINPEKLTPEELEMVNGGCILFGSIIAVEVVFVAVGVLFAIAAAVAQLAAVNNAIWYQEYGADEMGEAFQSTWDPTYKA